MDEVDVNDLPGVPEPDDRSSGRREYAFDNRTGACKQRVDSLADFVSRGHGVISVPTAQTALRIGSAPLVSRALGAMVAMDEMRRARIFGSTAYAWGTTPRFARQYHDIKPGARFFPRLSTIWRPHPEFVHDEITLRGMAGLALPEDYLTEQEVSRELPHGVRPPDGVVRLQIGERWWVANMETVKSRQTGKQGGCAKVADQILNVFLDRPLGRWATSLGRTNATLVVASMADGLKIATRIRKYVAEFEDMPRVWFLFMLLTKSDGEPFEEYKELDVFARLSSVHLWRAENDSPNVRPIADIWTPWI